MSLPSPTRSGSHTCRDPLVKDAAWYSLRDTVHRKTGRDPPAPPNLILSKYMSGSMEGRLGTNVGDATSLWSRT
ncbi:hypothetical protein J437_LFUL019125 [Ladona fulva]|uniref:Uncharacterized protein n=1 Tax=Ladona fulva TaxID=123851 RepID=A0A8K0PDG5_LADFU|nr:hypothetical protein J437_LFUL019125 [Ladona fulva]